ncbi:MAG: hypothetical protein FOGNACKC_00804 [Anaerolineae bacterium]|nr:hypothetical protein [Anaerolineae bacterium]
MKNNIYVAVNRPAARDAELADASIFQERESQLMARLKLISGDVYEQWGWSTVWTAEPLPFSALHKLELLPLQFTPAWVAYKFWVEYERDADWAEDEFRAYWQIPPSRLWVMARKGDSLAEIVVVARETYFHSGTSILQVLQAQEAPDGR